MKVNYLCPLAQQTGVARAAHDYCMALLEAGVDLTIIPIFDCDTDLLEPHYKRLADVAVADWPKDTKDDIWILHAMPSDVCDLAIYLPDCRFKVCVTTWETSMLPLEFANPINSMFDLVIVPSDYTKQAFLEAVMEVEVEVLPHAIGPLWNADRKWVGIKDIPYTFYTIGAWGERKNILGLLKAYLTEFDADEDVELFVKTNRTDDCAIEALKLGTNLEKFPRVVYNTEWMSESRLRDGVHQPYHCYVTATRGEGFGLGAFEACALGKPVIAPHIGGQAVFLKDYGGAKWTVACFQTPAVWTQSLSVKTISVGKQLLELKAIESIAPKGIDGRQYWLEPDLSALQDHMRKAFEGRVGCDSKHPSFGCEHVQRVRAEFFDRYGYATIGEAFKHLLEAL